MRKTRDCKADHGIGWRCLRSLHVGECVTAPRWWNVTGAYAYYLSAGTKR